MQPSNSLLTHRDPQFSSYAREHLLISDAAGLLKTGSDVIKCVQDWYAKHGRQLQTGLLAESHLSFGTKIKLSVTAEGGEPQIILSYHISGTVSSSSLMLAPKSQSYLEYSLRNRMSMLLLDEVSFNSEYCWQHPNAKAELERIFEAYKPKKISEPQIAAPNALVSKANLRSWGHQIGFIQPRAMVLGEPDVVRSQLEQMLENSPDGVFLKPSSDAFIGRGILKLRQSPQLTRAEEGVSSANINKQLILETCDFHLIQALRLRWPDCGAGNQQELKPFEIARPGLNHWRIRADLSACADFIREHFSKEEYILEEKIDFLSYQIRHAGVDLQSRFKCEFRFLYCWDEDRRSFSLQGAWPYESSLSDIHKYNSSLRQRRLDQILEDVVSASVQQSGHKLEPNQVLENLFAQVDFCAQEFNRRASTGGDYPDYPIAIDVTPVQTSSGLEFALMEVNQASTKLKIGAQKLSGTQALRLCFSEWKHHLSLQPISALVDVEDY